MPSLNTGTSVLRGATEQYKTAPLARMWLFARNFFKSPAMLGSLVPSSRFLVNDVLSRVDWERARIIVEFGPGVGTLTREILRRMHREAVLIAMELNQEFSQFLDSELRDSRLRVVNVSAAAVRDVLQELGFAHADYIISGLPYTNMPDAARRLILRQSRAVLREDGALLIYQFTGTILPYLQSSFGSVRQQFQPLNILPARIFHCTP